MSLWFYDPFRAHSHPTRSLLRRRDPFGHFFDDMFSDVPRIPNMEGLGEMTTDDDGQFKYSVNVAGFQPEELSVDLNDEEVIVRGEHREESSNERVFRRFERHIALPEDCKKETVKCDLDTNGRLFIEGSRTDAPEGSKRSIPIGIKPAIEQK